MKYAQLRLEEYFSKVNVRLVLFIGISLCLLGSYYYFTIPANSFSLDQYKIIELSRENLEGKFRWVGMRTSRLNWNFPMIHYLLTPVVAISSSPYALYFSVSISYIIGLWCVGWILIKYRPFSEFFVFSLFSLTHIWSLFYSSFTWPPNYIPFFISLFFVCFIYYIRNSRKVIYFHLASVLLNIAFQLHPMSFVLIIGFILALAVLGKLPLLRHWFLQIGIQLFMVSPWVIYHLFIIDWSKEPAYHSSLFKDVISPLKELFNYLSGVGLTREHTLYLVYGTNTYPYENFFIVLLSVGGVTLSMLFLWTVWILHNHIRLRNISFRGIHRYCLPYHQEEKDFNRSYPISLYMLLLPSLFYLISGISMQPHYFQFLTPLIFLLVAVLPGQLQNQTLRTIAIVLILGVAVIQGGFSYWRAGEEHEAPYLDDIGYTHVLAEAVAERCADDPRIRFFTTQGVKAAGSMFYYRYDPELEKLDRLGKWICKDMIVFQNKLIKQSDLINWYLKQLNPMIKLESNNNQIWIMGKR